MNFAALCGPSLIFVKSQPLRCFSLIGHCQKWSLRLHVLCCIFTYHLLVGALKLFCIRKVGTRSNVDVQFLLTRLVRSVDVRFLAELMRGRSTCHCQNGAVVLFNTPRTQFPFPVVYGVGNESGLVRLPTQVLSPARLCIWVRFHKSILVRLRPSTRG